MLCYTHKWVIHCYFKFCAFAFWNLSPEKNCRMTLTKVKFFFNQIFLHFGQFYFYSRQLCNKRLANWTVITVTDTLTFNEFTTGMLSMVLTLGNGQIWLGIPPVVLQFILVFFHVMVYNCLFAKNILSHSLIGKRTECVWQYVPLKNLNFLLGT